MSAYDHDEELLSELSEDTDCPESETLPDDPAAPSALEGIPDDRLVEMAQQRNDEAMDFLLNKYKNFVRSKARSYFLVGADHEDIVQEGMIGLYKAIRDYQPERLSSFHAFAELCITRQIITAIKTATRQKHVPLNNYISLSTPIYEDESDRTLMDVMEGNMQSPEDMILGSENLFQLLDRASSVLSPLEKDVLSAYLDGKSYQEIAEKLQRGEKTVDNALQRVKHKMEKFLEQERSKESNN